MILYETKTTSLLRNCFFSYTMYIIKPSRRASSRRNARVPERGRYSDANRYEEGAFERTRESEYL